MMPTRLLALAALLLGPPLAAKDVGSGPAPVPAIKPSVAFDGLPYDPANVFARILRGELPVVKVYEDAQVLAFMDKHPRAPGHVLVISRTSHARNILEIDQADLDRVMAVAKRIALAERTALRADGIVLQQNNGAAQSVPHLHVHVIPVHAGTPLLPPETAQSTLPELEAVAVRLRAALAAQR